MVAASRSKRIPLEAALVVRGGEPREAALLHGGGSTPNTAAIAGDEEARDAGPAGVVASRHPAAELRIVAVLRRRAGG